jgi:bacillolysin
MNHLIRLFTFVILFSNYANSQALKKPHTFILPTGVQIQDKKLTKPVFVPVNLHHRGFGYSAPTYKALNAASLPKSKSEIQILDMDENGFPSRILFYLPSQKSKLMNIKDWSGLLAENLKLGPETGIEYQLREQMTDEQGILHLKFDQYFDGIPVLDAEYFIHQYADQSILAHGQILQPDRVQDPLIHESRAYSLAKQHLQSKGIICSDVTSGPFSWLKTGLQNAILGYWFDLDKKSWHLVFQLDIFPNVMDRWLVMVDAVTGQIVKSRTNHCMIHFHGSACDTKHDLNMTSPQGAETTMARDLFDINRTVHVWREGGSVYLIDASRPMFKATQFKLDKPVGAIWTLDGLNSNPNNIRVDQIKTSSNTWPKNGISAHYNAGLAFEYFANTHARNSINGKGGTII